MDLGSPCCDLPRPTWHFKYFLPDGEYQFIAHSDEKTFEEMISFLMDYPRAYLDQLEQSQVCTNGVLIDPEDDAGTVKVIPITGSGQSRATTFTAGFGTAWFGSEFTGQILSLDASGFGKVKNHPLEECEHCPSDLAVSADGKLWVGEIAGGTYVLDPRTSRWITPSTHAWLNVPGNDFIPTPDGDMWVYSEKSLSLLDFKAGPNEDPEIKTYLVEEETGFWIWHIGMLGPDHKLWFLGVGEGGFAILQFDALSEEWTIFPENMAVTDLNITAFSVGKDGSLWLGTSGGWIIQFIPDSNDPDGGEWIVFTGEDLPQEEVDVLLAVSSRSFWAAAGNTILRCRKTTQ